MGARTKADEDQDEEAGDGSLRLCAVSRTHKPLEELIRFVLGPDGTIVPDLARRLPGRGVWVEATRTTVAEAVRKKVFDRSLKRPVQIREDLPELVERLLRRRLSDALSLANKAGLVVAGFAKVESLMEAGRAALLLHAADAAADGVTKLNRKFKALAGPERAEEAIISELDNAEMSLAMGRPNVVHAAASEGGASQRIIEEARRLRRFRAGER